VAQLVGHGEALMGGERGATGARAIDDYLPALLTTQERPTTGTIRWCQTNADAESSADGKHINRPAALTREFGRAIAEPCDQRRFGFSPMNDRIDFAPPGRSKDSCSRFKAGSTIGHSW
jgi:hypothetical protein